MENFSRQLELLNDVVGLLIVNETIDADQLAKLSPFGYKETKVKLDELKKFIPALLQNWKSLKELKK